MLTVILIFAAVVVVGAIAIGVYLSGRGRTQREIEAGRAAGKGPKIGRATGLGDD